MSWWIWVLAGFLLLAIEFSSTTLHIGFFAVGAFVVAILVALGVKMPFWGELLTFTLSSLAAFFFLRPILVRKLKLNVSKPVDTFVGEAAVALGDIPAEGLGKAEMRGTTWSARNVGPEPLARGQRCTVTGIDGLVISVRG
ncbi:MAG TPA: NfeD family protein [Thermoanaerobaculia bacterium]|nr:NfeD family protein [Thermoanaerobaculia bacterium]